MVIGSYYTLLPLLWLFIISNLYISDCSRKIKLGRIWLFHTLKLLVLVGGGVPKTREHKTKDWQGKKYLEM